MFDVKVYVADVLIKASLQPWEGLASGEEVFVGLKEHDKGESVGHQVLREHSVTVLTMLTLLVL